MALPTLTLDAHDVLDIRSVVANQVTLGLVLLWSRDEPERVGEIVLMPSAVSGTRAVLGRGDGTPSLTTPRLMWMRQHPGRNSLTGPIGSPQISRDQLILELRGPRELELTNIGRATLVHCGQVVESVVLIPGGLVELQNRALLMCVQRPRELALAALPQSIHPFGAADAQGMVGESPAAWGLRSIIAYAAQHAPHVLICGPSGAGKGLVAQAIHGQSARAGRSMVSCSASAALQSLLDTELFATPPDPSQADTSEQTELLDGPGGSTLFVDELAALPQPLQARLARALDRGAHPLSDDNRPRAEGVRLIAATDQPVDALDEHLLACLRLRVELPGLGARREDIPLLAQHILRRLARDDAQLARAYFPAGDPAASPRLGCSLVQHLVGYSYTTHVRELEALLERAIALAARRRSPQSPQDGSEALDLWPRDQPASSSSVPAAASPADR